MYKMAVDSANADRMNDAFSPGNEYPPSQEQGRGVK